MKFMSGYQLASFFFTATEFLAKIVAVQKLLIMHKCSVPGETIHQQRIKSTIKC